MPAPLKPDDTLEMLAAHADDVKYASGVEERALIAYERFCFAVAMQPAGARDDAIQNYGCGRRILIAAIRGAPDVSLAATPASDDLRNGLQILTGAQARLETAEDGFSIYEMDQDLAAVARLLRAALGKLEAK